MSYLSNRLRLHFAGTFQATVSTVNNDVTHFDNSSFQPDFQKRQGPKMDPPNGWWNPAGDGVWRLMGCRIKSAVMCDGSSVPSSDPVLAMEVADSGNSVAAKIVDLDPQQQMVSTIFGLTVRIADGDGNTLMTGTFDAAPFSDIWGRIQSGGASGDMAYGAMWQSVIRKVQWGDISASPFLQALQAAAQANGGLLSMKFNVDSYNMTWPVPGNPDAGNNFCRGRIVGTIGVASCGEPAHFVLGRQMVVQQQYPSPYPAAQPPPPPPPYYNYTSYLNHCPAVVDTVNNVVRVDLGNALPVDGGGLMIDQGTLSLVVTTSDGMETIGSLAPDGASGYTGSDWYPASAGIVEFPLTTALATLVSNNPIGLTLSNPIAGPIPGFTPPAGVLTGEIPPCPGTDGSMCPGGLFVRADGFVLRLNPQEDKTIDFYATQYGQPFEGVINLSLNPSGLQGPQPQPGQEPPATLPGNSGNPPYSNPPYVGYPYDGLLAEKQAFTSPVIQVNTHADGRAQVTFTGGDTQMYRRYIDGQVYGVGYALAAQGFDPANSFPTSPTPYKEDTVSPPLPLYDACQNTANFVSILVFDSFTPDNPITWQGCLQPIFQQYSNLYPVMSRFIDLGQYDQVLGYTLMLQRAFGLPEDDPNAMPVTRDLSKAKRAAILQWLQDPQKGAPSVGELRGAAAPVPAQAAARPDARKGGKSAAIATMMGARAVRAPGR